MNKVVLAARLLLGLIFTVFGANYVLNFIPFPEPSEAAAAFMGALFATGYVFPIIKTIEFVCGLMLLTGRGVPLALTLLAPVVVNIFLYNLMLDPAGLPMGILVLVLTVFLAWAYRGSFAGVLDFGARPTA